MSRETGRELTVVAMEDCEFLVVDVLDFPDTGLKPIILSQLDERFNSLRYGNHANLFEGLISFFLSLPVVKIVLANLTSKFDRVIVRKYPI